jgi:NAD(P)-dependent dehydrogenase (short-subunit alcohol dehydrogenase family)
MMVALVTGANRGIGLEFCSQLTKRDGYQVIAVCRQNSSELEKLGVQVHTGVDVTDATALSHLASKVHTGRIDLLICNAGVFLNDEIEKISKQNLVKQLEVNAVGPVLCVSALLPLLNRGAKIGLITSRMGSIADNDSGAYYGYRMSKAALNAAGVSMSIDLKPKGIAVAILHPGYVQTDMTGHQGQITTTQSVEGMRKVIDKVNIDNTGTFWHTNGEILPW